MTAADYPSLTSDTDILNQIFGKDRWRLTGGYRSPAREDQLRAQGADTVAPGRTSDHSLGGEDDPGALDITVAGMSPAEAQAVLQRSGAPFGRYLPEGAQGGQGAHLHIDTGKGMTPAVPGLTAAQSPVLAQMGLLSLSPEQENQFDEVARTQQADTEAAKKAIDAEAPDLAAAKEKLAGYTAPTPPAVPTLADEGPFRAAALSKVSNSPNDPSRVFTQWLPMVAMIGGALSRKGALASLTAMGAAMKAARTNDQAAIEQAHSDWVDKNKQMLDQFHAEIEGYNGTVEKHKDDIASMSAQLGVDATTAEDAKSKALLDQGMMEPFFQLLKTKDAAYKTLSEVQYHQEMADAAKERANAAAKGSGGGLDADGVKYYAELLRTKGPSALGRLSKEDRAKVVDAAAADAGGNADADIRTQNEGVGSKAAETSAGRRYGQLLIAEKDMQGASELATQAYAKVPRGALVPFNQLQKMVDEGTSSPEQAQAYAADNAVVNIYARMISPTGQGTDSDKNHARKILNDNAYSHEAHDAAVAQLLAEGRVALAKAKEGMSDIASETPVAGGPPPPPKDAPLSSAEKAESLANAKKALAAHPAARAAILKRLTDAGISTQGL